MRSIGLHASRTPYLEMLSETHRTPERLGLVERKARDSVTKPRLSQLISFFLFVVGLRSLPVPILFHIDPPSYSNAGAPYRVTDDTSIMMVLRLTSFSRSVGIRTGTAIASAALTAGILSTLPCEGAMRAHYPTWMTLIQY